jgi:superfamily II DNA or RNA helicase
VVSISNKSKNIYLNLKHHTDKILTKHSVPHLSFVFEGTRQKTSNIKSQTLDPRLPDFHLYEYQYAVYKGVVQRKNILIVSGTGSGKTEATFFPILTMLKQGIPGQVLAVYPTNVLARQQRDRLINDYLTSFGLSAQHWAGETVSTEPYPVKEILTTNPSFLLDNFNTKKRMQTFKEKFNQLQTVIFDEIHMYSARQMALLSEVLRIIKPPQIIFLSATVGNLDEVADFITGVNDIQTLTYRGSSSKAPTRYILFKFGLSQHDLISLLMRYLDEPGMTLCFTSTIREADDLKRTLIDRSSNEHPRYRGMDRVKSRPYLQQLISSHHSSLSKKERDLVERRLKYGGMMCFSPKTLAQGIDIGNVTRIIHIGLPSTLAEFLQREGRSGRRVETTLTETIIIEQSQYDHLICSNEDLFRRYLQGNPERILLIPDSPVGRLYRSLNGLFYKKDINQKDLFSLLALKLAEEDEHANFRITPKGKAFRKVHLKFFGPTTYINYLGYDGRVSQRKERISGEDVYLKFQPHTIHFRNGVLQKVLKYEKQGIGEVPVFSKVPKNSKTARLFRKNSLRSNVNLQITLPKSTKNYGIGELTIIPRTVQLSYLDTSKNPPKFEKFKSYNAIPKSVNLLTYYAVLEFTFAPVNMEIAVHCLMNALRINLDISYSELRHIIYGQWSERNKETMRLVIYESTLSGLLKTLQVDPVIEQSIKIFDQYMNEFEELKKKGDSKENDLEVPPLHTCRYVKRKADFIFKGVVYRSFEMLKTFLHHIQSNE